MIEAILGYLVLTQTLFALYAWEPATGPVAGYVVTWDDGEELMRVTEARANVPCAGHSGARSLVVTAFDADGTLGPSSIPSEPLACPATAAGWNPDSNGDGDVDAGDFLPFVAGFRAGNTWP